MLMTDDEMPDAAMSGAMPEEADSEKPSPEEQQQYEQIVSNALMLIHSKKSRRQVEKMLEGGDDPIEGLARAAATIIVRVAQAAQQAGVKPDGIVMWHAGTEIFEDLANVAKEAGIHDFSANPDDMETAYLRALDNVRTMLQESGAINQEAAASDLEKLKQMDESGELRNMLTGLAEKDVAPKGEREPDEGDPGEQEEPDEPAAGGFNAAAKRVA